MKNIINFLIHFSEILFFHNTLIKIEINLPYKIIKKQEDKIDKDCPILYELVVDIGSSKNVKC